MNSASIRQLVTAALFAALTCIATLVIQLHITPTGGYVNLGDCIVLLCAWVLPPPYAMAAAGLGSMMADVVSGYAYYAPATVTIKALMALCGGAVFRLVTAGRKARFFAGCAASAAAAETVMALGYCAYDWFFLGFGPAALAGMPGNLLQAVCGGVSATVVYLLLRRNKTVGAQLERFHE